MKCKTCGRELYADGSCALMCVWTNQAEHPCGWPIELPLRVTYKCLIPPNATTRIRYIDTEATIS